MERSKAIELLNKALGCVQTDPRNCGKCKKCENYATKEDGIEAIRMAIAALKKAPTALDHIHNVVSEREYQRGYEQGKAETNCPEIPDSWIPVSERLPVEKQDVLIMFNNNMAVGFWEETLEDGNPVWYANSGDGWYTGTENVDSDGVPIAWMPLPEPHKEGE